MSVTEPTYVGPDQRSAIPGIGIEVLTLGPVLVLVLGIDLGLLAVLVLVLGIVPSLLEVLVLVLGIDHGLLTELILVFKLFQKFQYLSRTELMEKSS